MYSFLKSWWLRNFTTRKIFDVKITLTTGQTIVLRNLSEFKMFMEGNFIVRTTWEYWNFEKNRLKYINPQTISSIIYSNQ